MNEIKFNKNRWEFILDVTEFKNLISDYEYIVNKYLVIPIFTDKDYVIIGNSRVQDLLIYLQNMNVNINVDYVMNNEDKSGNKTQIIYASTNQMILDGFIESPVDREFIKEFESDFIPEKHTPRYIFKFNTEKITKDYMERIIGANTCLLNQDIDTFIIPDAEELKNDIELYKSACQNIHKITLNFSEDIRDLFTSYNNEHEYIVILEDCHIELLEKNQKTYNFSDLIELISK